MTEIVLADSARYEEANAVMELFVENQNLTTIAKQLDIPRTRVQEHVEEWKASSVGTKFLQDRVEELLALLDAHWSELILDARKIYNEAKDYLETADHKTAATYLNQMNAALKTIGEFEAKRIDVLQKAGLLEAADLGDQFAEQEEKQQILIGILHNITANCNNCAVPVANELARVTGQAPVVIVQHDD